MFEITIHIPALDRVAVAIEALVTAANTNALNIGAAIQNAESEAPVADAPRRGRPPKQEASAEVEVEAQDVQDNDPPTVAYAEVKAAAVKLSQAKGREALVKALAQFNAPTGISAVKEPDWPAFIATCEGAMA